MNKSLRPMTTLQPGETGLIERLDLPDVIKGKFLELGLCPGETVQLIRRSPFGDPIEIEFMGYRLAVRNSEASKVFIS